MLQYPEAWLNMCVLQSGGGNALGSATRGKATPGNGNCNGGVVVGSIPACVKNADIIGASHGHGDKGFCQTLDKQRKQRKHKAIGN